MSIAFSYFYRGINNSKGRLLLTGYTSWTGGKIGVIRKLADTVRNNHNALRRLETFISSLLSLSSCINKN